MRHNEYAPITTSWQPSPGDVMKDQGPTGRTADQPTTAVGRAGRPRADHQPGDPVPRLHRRTGDPPDPVRGHGDALPAPGRPAPRLAGSPPPPDCSAPTSPPSCAGLRTRASSSDAPARATAAGSPSTRPNADAPTTPSSGTNGPRRLRGRRPRHRHLDAALTLLTPSGTDWSRPGREPRRGIRRHRSTGSTSPSSPHPSFPRDWSLLKTPRSEG